MKIQSYGSIVWQQFKKNRIALIALYFLIIFFLVGLYAPLLSSSKPLLVLWNQKFYFPLFKYLFYPGFYTKPIDLFYNLLMFTVPCAALALVLLKSSVRKYALISIALIQTGLFIWVMQGAVKNPEQNLALNAAKQKAKSTLRIFREDPLLAPFPSHAAWSSDLSYLSSYAQLNQLLHYKQMQTQHNKLAPYLPDPHMPTLWHVWQRNEQEKIEQLQTVIQKTKSQYLQKIDTFPRLINDYRPYSHAFLMAKYAVEHPTRDDKRLQAQTHFDSTLKNAIEARVPLVEARKIIEQYQKASANLSYLNDKQRWLDEQSKELKMLIPALIRQFHWEDDAGGAQKLNKHVPWWELTRVNRKDLMASLLFGIRISIVVGVTAVILSLFIGIPLGMIAGYFAGKTDLVVSRFIEIWEAMPTFFMLLLIVAVSQSKSIFLVIGVLGIFGWTGIGRFMRAEVLKHRNLPYVLSCHTMGYTHKRVMFSHILPNAIAPILTLLPFAMMAAITSEAGLSFLGLGEEGSTSWGVLMDEGRSVFPSESYLLWPPAILLTLLLISIALVGDGLRDAIDPKMRD